MATPVLYVFAISHYCEKARWALDYQSINYNIQHLPPGIHGRVAKKLGAPTSSLPILQVGTQIIQGSGNIISWAEANKAAESPTLACDETSQLDLDGLHKLSGEEIGKRLDDVLGVHVRRYYYSEALVDYPQLVRPIFVRDLTPFQQGLTNISWGVIRKLMARKMDLGHSQGLESRQLLEAELDWLDQLLAGGGQYLIGRHLTRVDITAASLLAPLVLPQEHPTYAGIKWSPNVAVDCETWQNRRSLQWVKEIYRKYR
ncbi:MAG: glutathione S-transferase N-terminal domain-containing protein [Gammaproteobacteria bacterium]|nr:glutathione S-transferase N-terminal domain-containing protein [Gammaproteobacteria bacterium]